jgi:hypothetical protein
MGYSSSGIERKGRVRRTLGGAGCVENARVQKKAEWEREGKGDLTRNEKKGTGAYSQFPFVKTFLRVGEICAVKLEYCWTSW